jgi:hypothetical protein
VKSVRAGASWPDICQTVVAICPTILAKTDSLLTAFGPVVDLKQSNKVHKKQ